MPCIPWALYKLVDVRLVHMFRRTVQISVLVCSQNFSTQEPQAGTKMEGEDDLLTAKARGRGELGNREIVSRVSRALRLYSRVLLAYLRGVSVDRLRDSFCPYWILQNDLQNAYKRIPGFLSSGEFNENTERP